MKYTKSLVTLNGNIDQKQFISENFLKFDNT